MKKKYTEIQEDFSQIINSLLEQNIYFSDQILHMPIIGYHELGPAQSIYLDNPDYSGFCKRIELELDEKALNLAFNCLIEQQGFLRSCLIKEANTYKWQVHQFNDNIRIPIVDITAYPENSRERIINECIEKVYLHEYKLLNTIKYRICIIRDTKESFIIMAPMCHIIFDAMSANILLENLFCFYEELLQKGKINQVITTEYSSYLKQMRKGPVNIKENELITMFKIGEFYQRMINMNISLNAQKHIILPEYYECHLSVDKDPFTQSVEIISDICKKYLYMTQVPLFMVNMGRIYENNVYMDLIGLFIDFVPVVYDSKNRENISGLMNLLNIKREKNINFLMFLTKEWSPKGFEKVTKYLSECYKMIKILFNFIGEVQNNEEFDKNINSISKNNSERTILFTALIWDDVLHIKCNLSNDLSSSVLDSQMDLIS
ncbi:condensation domain-containing protein [Kineothrix alysoides]|uniref:Condensation domain-containing protein n=1 Tax=Kineothrix alysoides TaxID=1469948 RepID=A0A4V2QBT2_9FIRM|nr:condensation domain-containing protein [Kineothrix alysoides]TCL57592.1 condensation domain-containing protein [Kineothrix alysoides]